MSSNDEGNKILPDNRAGRKQLPPFGSPSFPAVSKSMEASKKGSKTGLQGTTIRWHSAPTAVRDDEEINHRRPPGTDVPPAAAASPAVFKTTAVIEVAAGGGCGGGWKPLQRQKVVTAAPTLEEDEDGGRSATAPPAVSADSEHDGSSAVVGTDRVRKRSVTVRRGYSCQETCAARRSTATATATAVACTTGNGTAGVASGATENRRRWLSAGTGSGQTAGNSKSMECLSPTLSAQPQHRSSFIMAADDRKSLDSGLDDVAAAEMADRRRGMFASTRTSVPSHLSLALPSCERRLTILSPHTQTPSTPAAYSSSAVECAWHFSTSSVQHQQQVATAATACRARKKARSGMVLPRLVLPGSSDLDIFSQ